MIAGITEEEISIIKNILKDYTGEFFAYGSRVTGGFSPISDLDILVKCESFEKFKSELKFKFDKSRLPYIVNFTDYNSIDKNFYDLIKKDLVKLN